MVGAPAPQRSAAPGGGQVRPVRRIFWPLNRLDGLRRTPLSRHAQPEGDRPSAPALNPTRQAAGERGRRHDLYDSTVMSSQIPSPLAGERQGWGRFLAILVLLGIVAGIVIALMTTLVSRSDISGSGW